jgi:RimJ/RimL family protein N-acetyltransferase
MSPAPVEETVRRAKGLASESGAYSIPILNDERAPIGSLLAIDSRRAGDLNTVELLTRWRQQSMQFFLTQFQATVQRTSHWLSEIVLPDDTRLLFLVLDETGEPRGTLGVCGIGPNAAEIDNVNRGEHGGHRRLMYFALASLIDWLYRELGLQNIFLRVLSYNSKAIALYDSIGFQHAGSAPLLKRQTPDTLIYEVADQHLVAHGEPVDFQLITMALDRQSFYKRHPWL